jgi:hypothetical protein
MKKRKAGRPPRGSGPRFPRDEVARVLVDGELVFHPNGQLKREFPGVRALANRYDVSPSTISRFARSLNISSTHRAVLRRGSELCTNQAATPPSRSSGS